MTRDGPGIDQDSDIRAGRNQQQCDQRQGEPENPALKRLTWADERECVRDDTREESLKSLRSREGGQQADRLELGLGGLQRNTGGESGKDDDLRSPSLRKVRRKRPERCPRFWGFYAACNVPILDIDADEGRVFFSATTIYLTPTTLSAITFNFLMSLAGGMMAGYFVSKGDPFWTFSGGLAGIITASAGNDLYHPLQAYLIAGGGVLCIYKLHYWVEKRFKIDDAVGAVAVHGYAGVLGVVVAGFVLWGYPSSPNPDYAAITPWGQLAGAVIMFFVLGFLPCYIIAWILKRLGLLRIPELIELAGMDHRVEERAVRQSEEIFDVERGIAKKRTGNLE